MKKNNPIYLLITFLLIMVGCGESLEDTYKDYAGDGEIRYVGMCKNMKLSPGWERLLVSWENSVDPTITHVKVSWMIEERKDSILLDKGTTSYSINDLGNAVYEVSVSSVNELGNSSIGITLFDRPFTEEHETVKSFTRLVARHFYVEDRLAIIFLGWQDDNIIEAILKYTHKNGEEKELILTKELVNSLYYLLPDEIDVTKPISLYRIGKIDGCEDEIIFSPYVLEHDKLYSSDLKQMLKTKYGFMDQVPEEWVSKQTELEFDADISSFEDILYFPNLKKVVLGKNRYLASPKFANEKTAKYSVYEVAKSNFVLKVANEVRGITVERYNKHYEALKQEPFLKEMGNPIEPEVQLLNLNSSAISLFPKDAENQYSYPENLVDGNLQSNWTPFLQLTPTTYEITLDIQTVKRLSGLKFVQKEFTDEAEKVYAPLTIKIKVSEDMISWSDATYVEENYIGASSGERNYIPFVSGGKDARWVKIIVSAVYSQNHYKVTFAELGLY